MSQYNNVYKHSGKIGPAAFLVPVLGVIGAIILSFIYAYINVYSPIVGYITILFVLGFAFGVGFVISLAGEWGKCRNSFFLNITGFLISLFALYCSWVIFIYALVKKTDSSIELNLISMFLSPDKIWALIKGINQTGWYSVFSWTPSGTILWIFWIIEALIIVVLATLISSGSISSKIFCERCSKWCAALESFHLAFPQDTSQQEQLKSGYIEKLEELDPVSASQYPHLSVVLFGCDNCKDTAGFKLELVTVEVDKDGKENEEKEDFSPLFILPYHQFEKLKALGERPVKKDGDAA